MHETLGQVIPTGIEGQPATDNQDVKSHKLIHRFGRTEPAVSDGHYDVLVNNADMSPLYEDIRDVSEELATLQLSTQNKGFEQ
jgi:hypothetical protein